MRDFSRVPYLDLVYFGGTNETEALGPGLILD